MAPLIKIGTRGSNLALAQAHETRDRLIASHDLAVDSIEIVVISTTGDRVQDRPLAEIGGKGLFTKEIEEALLDGSIHMAVHSMKDMPAAYPDGLVMTCILPREDPRDAFLSPVAASIADLPQGAKVGSSSVRRAAQLHNLRPDIEIMPYRGNVETRLRKLHEGQVDATFLACAGLKRLGLAAEITQAIPVEQMLPAVGQGAIGVQINDCNKAMHDYLAPLNDPQSAAAVAAERGFLSRLDGSCRTPLAAHAVIDGARLRLSTMALTMTGDKCFTADREGPVQDGAAMGIDAAEDVLAAAGGNLFG